MPRLALTLGAALLLAAMPAAAQQAGPLPLTPAAPPPEAPEPAADPNPAADPAPDPGGFVIRELDAVAKDATGVLGDSDGGLGLEMWSGTSRRDAAALLEALPKGYAFRAMRDLVRRLLLTTAAPPRGEAGDDAELFALRVSKLVEMGALDDALGLAGAASSRAVPDGLARSVITAHFLRGDAASGCDVLGGYAGEYAGAFWQKALIVCQIAAGRGAEASFGLDLLREEGIGIDAAFRNVVHAAAAGAEIAPEHLEPPGTPDALTFALLAAAGAPIPDWIVAPDDPGLARAALSAEGLDPDRKLAAAHAAFRARLLESDELRATYEGIGVDDDEIAAALLDPETVSRDRRFAYLYLAAKGHTVAVARSEALREAWASSARADARDAEIVTVATAPLLAGVPATTDFGWLAPAAARAALLAGQDGLALEWYQLVERQARTTGDMARAATLLWPAMRAIGRTPEAPPAGRPAETDASPAPDAAPPGTEVATAGAAELVPSGGGPPASGAGPAPADAPRSPVPWDASRLAGWIDLARDADEAADIGDALHLLELLGDPVSEDHWRAAPTDAAGGGGVASVALLSGLARAAAAGRKAETVLYAAQVLGQAGDDPHASVTGAVVDSLRRVGLDAPARAMVRAALVADMR